VGGLGSGRKFDSSLPVSRDFVPCDIATLSRIGLFRSIAAEPRLPSRLEVELNGDDSSSLHVRIVRDAHTRYGNENAGLPPEQWISQTSMFIEIATSRPNYGGVRFWFVCPRTGCARRCRVLYRPRDANARAFACRNCHRMVYQTQRAGKTSRLVRKLDRKTDRFVVIDGWLQKPKGMHWRRYHTLCDEIDFLSESLWKRTFSRYQSRRLTKEHTSSVTS
jgi:hypothetical protein